VNDRVRRVVIAGGGLAGIAAALRLVEFGVEVTLLETRRKLGGRATSFTDPRTGDVLDNCQHVVLGCCTNYLDLLGRLGVAGLIQWHSRQYWLEAGGACTVLKPCGVLPAPLHYSMSMLVGELLTQRQQRALARACLAILRAERGEFDEITFGEYLRGLDQPEDLIARFWSPIVVSACNCDVSRVSAMAALHVFQEGFLANARAGIMGVPRVPLVRLYDRAFEALERAGGRVLLGESVERIEGRRVVTSAGVEHAADRVICALPFERVARTLDPAVAAADPRIGPLERFTHSPILGVHVTFDRPVLEHPHAVLVERPTQWLFRKIEPAEAAVGGRQTLHAVISAADDWMSLTEDQIGARVLEDVRACVPAARGAGVVRVRSVKEKRATFAPLPGLASIRPPSTPPPDLADAGVILAGDYTSTGWPATMEGATRSGYAAAAVALGLPEHALFVPDLKPSALAAALSGL
jgi:squalene-associated FAD-dependent desaturase